jgi:hypothetical protein
MMNKEQMAKTAQLDQFDEELYKVLHNSHPLSVGSRLFILYRLLVQMTKNI